MRRFLLPRLALLPVLALGISMLVFLLVNFIPGDPARIYAGGERATEAQVQEVREQYGLDKPLPVQYLTYVSRVARGDFGYSLTYQRSVGEALRDRFPATIELTFAALLVGVPIGLALGIAAATRRNSWVDQIASLVSITGVSIPLFWLGLMLAWLFSVKLGLLPLSGRLPQFATLEPITGINLIDAPLRGQWTMFGDTLRHLVLPTLTLAVIPMAIVSRFARASFIEVLSQDYIRTARAYGIPQRRILREHAARNALLPLVTVLGVLVPALLAGAVLTETVFSWPGVGTLLFEALLHRDYAVIMSVTLIVGILYVLANLAVDASYAVLDPRTRKS